MNTFQEIRRAALFVPRPDAHRVALALVLAASAAVLVVMWVAS